MGGMKASPRVVQNGWLRKPAGSDLKGRSSRISGNDLSYPVRGNESRRGT